MPQQRPRMQRAQSMPNLRYQPPKPRTWAQSIYEGAETGAKWSQRAGWGALASTPVTHAGGLAAYGCAKVVKGVCVLAKTGARMAGGGPRTGDGFASDASGIAGGAAVELASHGLPGLSEAVEVGGALIDGGRMINQGRRRFMGRQ